MSDDLSFERLLADMLADSAPTRTPDRLVPDILAAAHRTRRRPRWLALVTERPMRRRAEVLVGSPALRLAYIGVLLLLALLAVGSVAVGASVLLRQNSVPPDGRGAFTPTDSLDGTRAFVSATLLADGRVLVVGGNDGESTLVRDAAIWDPATGSFGPADSLLVGRWGHTATALQDGRVLVVGGRQGEDGPPGPAINSAELWDPVTERFRSTGPPAGDYAAHSATLLADGRVLVVGGLGPRSAELFDPASETFTRTGLPVHQRAGHLAILLADGRVLVAGGTCGDIAVCSPEIWDPATGSFHDVPWVPEPHSGQSLTLLHDGRVLEIGGYGPEPDTQFSALARLWDPVTGAFTPAGSLAQPRVDHNATLLSDGRVLVTGGGTGPRDDPTHTAEVWGPSTLSFSPTGSLGQGRGSSATLLADGRVLVIGGGGPAGGMTPAEVYDPMALSLDR